MVLQGQFLCSRISAAAALAAVLLFASVVQGAEPNDWSPAQTLLFDTPHLENLTEPASLSYDFARRGSGDGDFADQVVMNVTEIQADGRKNLEFEFLSGERRRLFQPMSGFRGNPLVMLFLQWDVEGMKRATGGSERYFRNRIRYAFYDRAELDEVSVELDGRALTATRVVIRPFLDDPMKDRFRGLERKFYEFLIAPEVPGGIYRIRAVVPAADDSGQASEERLTYARRGA